MVLLYKEPIFSKQINFVVDVRMEQLLDVMKCNALSVYIGWNIYEICEIRLKFYQCVKKKKVIYTCTFLGACLYVMTKTAA